MRTAIAISLIGLMSLLIGCGSDPWTELKPKDGMFVVSMPSQPSEKQTDLELPLGHLKIVNYMITTNEITFALHYTDYPDTMTSGKSADALLDLGLDKMFSVYPRGHKKSGKIVFQGFPGRSFTIEDPDTSYTTIGRSCLVGHRIYVIQAVMPSKLSARPEVDRFIRSLRFEPPASQKD